MHISSLHSKNIKWLRNLISPLIKKKEVVAVYGRQEPYSYSNALDKRDLINTFGLDRKIQKKDPFFHNANSAFTKKFGTNFHLMKKYLMLKIEYGEKY